MVFLSIKLNFYRLKDWTVSFTILYLSFLCYSLYDAVIARARSSRTEGSRQLDVVLLVVF